MKTGRFGSRLKPLLTYHFNGLERLVLCGGKIGTPGPARASDYLDDAYAFDPENNSWRVFPRMPRPALLAPSVQLSSTQLAVCGGSDGHDLERMAELGSAYQIPDDVLVFDASTSVWGRAGSMPIGVVGAAVIEVDGGWILAGGEYSPGLRTPKVHLLSAGGRD
ncbi:MAG: hypothetical protein ACREIA_07150 [Opitutaceae bacterium]